LCLAIEEICRVYDETKLSKGGEEEEDKVVKKKGREEEARRRKKNLGSLLRSPTKI
jgi:hypothetical protein